MYLLDTNILVEFVLDQQNADQVQEFLRVIPPEQIFFTEFSLYSMSMLLVRRKRYDTLTRILDDLFAPGGVQIIRVRPMDLKNVALATKDLNLDFDDAYQYVAADILNLELISFDKDFDKTPRGRKTPAQILALLGK